MQTIVQYTIEVWKHEIIKSAYGYLPMEQHVAQTGCSISQVGLHPLIKRGSIIGREDAHCVWVIMSCDFPWYRGNLSAFRWNCSDASVHTERKWGPLGSVHTITLSAMDAVHSTAYLCMLCTIGHSQVFWPQILFMANSALGKRDLNGNSIFRGYIWQMLCSFYFVKEVIHFVFIHLSIQVGISLNQLTVSAFYLN